MRAIFLDRDGVVNRKAPDGAYISNVSEFEILPGAPEAIADLEHFGYEVFVVTNQRGIARGLVSCSDLNGIHARMLELVHEAGGNIRQIYVCAHDHIDQCYCRKPNPGLLLQAQREHCIDLQLSWMIGDSVSDILAGKRAGCRTAVVGLWSMNGLADVCASSLQEAVRKILKLEGHCVSSHPQPGDGT